VEVGLTPLEVTSIGRVGHRCVLLGLTGYFHRMMLNCTSRGRYLRCKEAPMIMGRCVVTFDEDGA
jgi:hypothetical protein